MERDLRLVGNTSVVRQRSDCGRCNPLIATWMRAVFYFCIENPPYEAKYAYFPARRNGPERITVDAQPPRLDYCVYIWKRSGAKSIGAGSVDRV